MFSCLPVQHAVTVRRVCEFELVHSRLQSVVAGYQSNMVSFCSLLGYRFVVACRYLRSVMMKIGVAAGDVPGSLPLSSAEAFDVLSNDAEVIARFRCNANIPREAPTIHIYRQSSDHREGVGKLRLTDLGELQWLDFRVGTIATECVTRCLSSLALSLLEHP